MKLSLAQREQIAPGLLPVSSNATPVPTVTVTSPAPWKYPSQTAHWPARRKRPR